MKKILFIVLGLALLVVAGLGAYSIFKPSGKTPAEPAGSLSPDELNEEPLFGGPATGQGEGDDPLFDPSSATLAPDASGSLTITSKGIHPDQWAGQPDQDQDGLPDSVEEIYHTLANNPDTDGDGYKDGEEVLNGYDPLKPGSVRLDTDGDGLLENEEFKWKTDPFNPDTDGDSFKDGEEIKNGYDPTVRGDGKGSDALPEKRAQMAEAALRPNPQSPNYTEGLAGILLGNTPLSQAGGVRVTPERIQQVLANARLNTALPEVPTSDINVQQTNTQSDIRAYLEKVNQLRPTELLDSPQLNNALMNAFTGQNQGIQSVRGGLENYIAALKRLPTPASAVEHQRTLIAVSIFISERLSVIEENGAADPVKAYLAARELQEGLPQHITKIETLKNNLVNLAG